MQFELVPQTTFIGSFKRGCFDSLGVRQYTKRAGGEVHSSTSSPIARIERKDTADQQHKAGYAVFIGTGFRYLR